MTGTGHTGGTSWLSSKIVFLDLGSVVTINESLSHTFDLGDFLFFF